MRQSPPNRTTCPIRLAGSGTGGSLSVPCSLFASARRAIRQLVSFKETAAAELDKVRPAAAVGPAVQMAVSGSLAYRPRCSWGERETSDG
jgi:hypothetical protein